MKIPKQEYTPEFREMAVKRVNEGQSIGAVAKELGLSDQTVRNWVKAAAAGKLDLFNFAADPTRLTTVWSLLLGGFAIMVTPREEDPQIVVPMMDVMRCGTTISPSCGLFRRLTTI